MAGCTGGETTTRTPIDVYRALIQTRLGEGIPERILSLFGKLSETQFSDHPLSDHLFRFVSLCCKLFAYLDSRYVAGSDDLTMAVDLLDHFTSTNKWWIISRKDPGLVLRPRLREPREFMKSLSGTTLSSETQGRIDNASDKLARFLEEHGVSESLERLDLYTTLSSTWAVLTGFICRNQGRVVASEQDFESAYDVVRILLFYASLDDIRALTASRRLATNPKLAKAARVALSPGFERKLESSAAAQLEQHHADILAEISSSVPTASRSILTNSLRLLVQIYANASGAERVEEDDYEPFMVEALHLLERAGLDPQVISNTSAVVNLFKGLRPADDIDERVSQLTRRLEGFIIDATGNRDFLLQHSRLVPRLIALLFLLAGGTKGSLEPLRDADLKRGIILFDTLLDE
jgi:hypothetical protein